MVCGEKSGHRGPLESMHSSKDHHSNTIIFETLRHHGQVEGNQIWFINNCIGYIHLEHRKAAQHRPTGMIYCPWLASKSNTYWRQSDRCKV